MLLFTRKFLTSFRNQQHKIWERRQDLTELRGKTVLVVGLGHIGKEVARLAHCFGATVFGIDRRNKEVPPFVRTLGTQEQLSELLPQADFVVLCLPHTKETHHAFGTEQFKAMNSSAIIINIGRGGVVDEEALIKALKQKHIAGAALDVVEKEPLGQDSLLWGMENVLITPHHSGWSEKYMDRAIERFCLNLQAFLGGKLLPNLVDKTAGY